MEVSVMIGGKEVRMRGSALIPKLYRYKFGRDIIVDMKALEKSFKKSQEDNDASLSALDLTIFENVAWLMAKQADRENIPDDPDEWLDSIEGILSIYEVLPAVLELWRFNNAQTSKPAKK